MERKAEQVESSPRHGVTVAMSVSPLPSLLAVDLGLRTGLALFGADGRLRWYRSRNFGTTARLGRGAKALLGEVPEATWLVLEGGGRLATVWEREAQRRGICVRRTSAEEWRACLLLPRERRSGRRAKRNADEVARKVIEWSGARLPTSLRHDAAEAILAGLWGVLAVGWLEELPPELRH